MKNIYLLLFILTAVTAKSQNWQTVYSDRVQYYDSGLNAIKIVSVQLDSVGDSIFRNYTNAYLGTHTTVTDSIAWVGKRIIIRNEGRNGFISVYGDTLWLKTLALPGEKWDFFKNDSVHIEASLDSSGFETYNDITDSVKYISLKEVYNKYTGLAKRADYSGFYDKKQIIFSKHHGFIHPIVFCNTNQDVNISFIGTSRLYQTKINLFTNRIFFNYEVEDEFHTTNLYHYQSNKPIWSIKQVIDKKITPGNDSIIYAYLSRTLFLSDYRSFNDYKIMKDTITYHTEVFTNLDEQVMGIWPASPNIILTQYPSFFNVMSKNVFYYKKIGSCIAPAISQRYGSFEGVDFGWLEAGKGREWRSEDYSVSPPYPAVIESRIVYAKNSCGTSGVSLTLGINKYNHHVFQIYPNPATTTVTITATENATIKLIDLQGREIPYQLTSRDNETVTIDVSGLSNGIYLLHIQSGNSIATHQLVVQH